MGKKAVKKVTAMMLAAVILFGMTYPSAKALAESLSDENQTKNVLTENQEKNVPVMEQLSLPEPAYLLSGEQGENGWYTDNVTVSAPAGYQISCDRTLPAEQWKDSIVYEKEGTGIFSVYLRDSDGNISEEVPVSDLEIDKSDPKNLNISYTRNPLDKLLEKVTFGFYQAPVTVTFSAQDTISGIASFQYWYELENSEREEKEVSAGDLGFKCNREDGTAEYTFQIAAPFRGKVSFRVKDAAGRTAEKHAGEAIVVDHENPIVTIQYQGALEDKVKGDTNPLSGESVKEADNTTRFVYSGPVTATVEVEEANFSEEDIKLTAMREGREITEGDGSYTCTEWKRIEGTNRHTCEITFHQEGDYEWILSYTDRSGNPMEYVSDEYAEKKGQGEYRSNVFSIDTTPPQTNRMKIDYSAHVNFWEEVLHAVTFGMYTYKDKVTVTMTAEDYGSGIAAFIWTYTGQQKNDWEADEGSRTETIPRENIVFSQDGGRATAEFTLTATEAEQYRGSITFHVTDRAGNISQEYGDERRIHIVDNIAPTRTVTYTPAKRVVDALTWEDRTGYQYDSERTGCILYYDGPVTATIRITEANFYPEDVTVSVNGEEPDPLEWVQQGDAWTGTLVLSQEGDYVISMTYTDRSANRMMDYLSEKIVIDTTDPRILPVSYSNEEVKDTVDGRTYFDREQQATITIAEHNFRAEDVKVKVVAKDVAGDEVTVADYGAYLSRQENWTRNGDTYTAVVRYSKDANYTFDISYEDLAARKAAPYPTERFTVDRAAPENLMVAYSTSVLDQVLEAVSFGFYKAPVKVRITADDATSGVSRFVYSCIRSDGASSVSGQLLDEVIYKADITREGKTFAAEFKVPGEIAGGFDQFHGRLHFRAYDKLGYSTEKADDRRIIVDTISPGVEVTIREPVRIRNDVSYYDSAIPVTVVVREANFYPEDVSVMVTKDQAAVSLTPKWKEDSPDVHIGTFTLHEDGDYIIAIDYADRSGNRMPRYTSGQLTIDTTPPVITVSHISPNSANKDETYGFTVTVNDSNVDAAAFEVGLTGILWGKDGRFSTEDIALGDMKVIETGKAYAYTVENLAEDAVYRLTCKAGDMAGNESEKFSLEDGAEYEAVRFSVNRNGSVFAVDEATEAMADQYYVYGVTHDVVIEEINVDPIETYAVKLNGENLREGRDYTTLQTDNDGEWSRRTYTIGKEEFAEEGTYHIVVESVDKTNTAAYSDVKNRDISWTVDRTAPVLTVSGLKENGRYQGDSHQVTVLPVDDGGRVRSLRAVVMDDRGDGIRDDKGNDISVRFDMSGEALETYLSEHDGKVTFSVPEGLAQRVEIVCCDYAVRED